MSNNIKPDFMIGKKKEDIIGNIGFDNEVELDKDRNIKVLVTGKDSYIGQSFIKYANKKYPNFQIDELDVRDNIWSETGFDGYDIVYHVAGIAHADVGNVSEEVIDKYYKVNRDLSITVCKKAKGDGVKTFIYMSSMIIYGDSAPFSKEKIVRKNTIPNPSNFYGESKLQADVAVRDLADDNFNVIVLRPPMVYGKKSKGNYVILSKLAKKLPIFPDLENRRSMLYIDNLCELLAQVMLIKKIPKNSMVLFPQNKERTKTSAMVKCIAKENNRNIILVGGLMKHIIKLLSLTPGKIGILTNKAFGNNCYDHRLSEYPGIEYQVTSLEDSILETEK